MFEKFTEEDINNVIDEIWIDEVLENSKFPKPVSDPKAFVFGGPPGAGKSSSMDKVAAEYLDSNALIISGDDYRRYHPNFRILKTYGDEWSLKTSEWSAAIYEKIFEKATKEKYNIQIEGTFRDKKIVLATLDRLKDKGYAVNIAVVVASRALSEESIKERYDRQKKAGLAPRAVSAQYLDEYYQKFSSNTVDIFMAQKHSIFVVFQREKGKPVEKVFDSTLSKEPITEQFIDKIINNRSKSFSVGLSR